MVYKHNLGIQAAILGLILDASVCKSDIGSLNIVPELKNFIDLVCIYTLNH